MPYDETFAARLREIYSDEPDVVEKNMFGGIAFMVSGHMSCGVVGDTLMARVGPDQYEECLAHEHAREMDFTGRPLRGFLFVAPEGTSTKTQLKTWVRRSMKFVTTLEPKETP